MHFFNPPIMALVEIVRGDATLRPCRNPVRDRDPLGQTPVRACSTPGFIVNRVAWPFYAERWPFEEGAAGRRWTRSCATWAASHGPSSWT